jgi:hypothetical protein
MGFFMAFGQRVWGDAEVKRFRALTGVTASNRPSTRWRMDVFLTASDRHWIVDVRRDG